MTQEHVCLQDDDRCENCCDHDDVCQDEMVCLDCGSCRREAIMSAAHEWAEGMER